MFLVGRAGPHRLQPRLLFSPGNYFASHFFMGGEKFDTPHPEGYLFGENMDLNFLGNRPVQVGLRGAGHVGGVARPPAATGYQVSPSRDRGAVETCA